MIKTVLSKTTVERFSNELTGGDILGHVTVGYEHDQFGQLPGVTFEIQDERTGETISLTANDIWRIVMNHRQP